MQDLLRQVMFSEMMRSKVLATWLSKLFFEIG